MPKTRRLHTATQNQILLALYALAKVKVEELVPGCYREEVVHELAVAWLERLRAGGWDLPREDWEDFVVGEIRNCRVEDYRGRKRTLARDAIHLRIVTDAPREWMSQDLMLEEQRLRGFTDTVRGTLPAKCVKAHAMIRDDQLTYAEVAKKLHVSERCVHEYVKTVHRTFRAALPSVGIEAPKQQRAVRPRATTEPLEPIAGRSTSSAGRRAATRDERESTRGDLESTRDDLESARDNRESTVGVNASSGDDRESTIALHASTGDEREPTRDEFESICSDFESTRDEFESTRGDFEPTRDKFEPTRGEFEPTRDDRESTIAENALARARRELTTVPIALSGSSCSAIAPVRGATSAARLVPALEMTVTCGAHETTRTESYRRSPSLDRKSDTRDTTGSASSATGTVR
jgi:DNA-directed RNA polymerase specialized sigma24 family protein